MDSENKFHTLLATAVDAKASDIHIKENSPAALRISAELVTTDFITDSEFMKEAILEIAPKPEDREKYYKKGDLDSALMVEGIGRFRVNLHRQRNLNAITLRHVKSKIMTVNQLGLPPILSELALSPRGIILLCGTTGSGKSTTMAAMLQYVNDNAARHIITVEDPIEYEFQDNLSFFEQREVGIDTESFLGALIGALRQDPDIIMVGEMRDRVSFEAALHAADTGHMVMSTVHAANASQAINRILDFFPKDEQDSIREALALNLRSTIAQRLLPKADGAGVVPAIEIMVNTPIVQSLLQKNKLDKLSAAIETGKEDGMQSFNQCLLQLIQSGQITEEVGMENAGNPEALRMNLQGIFLGSDNRILGD